MEKLQNIYQVTANDKLCPAFYRMRIDVPATVCQAIQPGQFVHLRVRDGYEPFFRRPFSVYRAQQGLEILYEAIGPGTRELGRKKPGDDIDVLGPVGTPFRLPSSDIRQVVMMAGGIGIAPFLILSDVLKDRNITMTLLYGGRSGAHVYEMTEFRENGVDVHVATDDGSVGVHGRITELFDRVTLDSSSTMIYTCGPNPMMAAVQAFAREQNCSGQAACEEVMACALGACLGCSIRTTNGFKTVCYDGPAFDLQEVIFDHSVPRESRF